MKRMYALVVNESRDPTIAEAVRSTFGKRKGEGLPLADFENNLSRKLKQANPVQLVGIDKTPLKKVEAAYKGTAYRVIDNVVYKTDPSYI